MRLTITLFFSFLFTLTLSASENSNRGSGTSTVVASQTGNLGHLANRAETLANSVREQEEALNTANADIKNLERTISQIEEDHPEQAKALTEGPLKKAKERQKAADDALNKQDPSPKEGEKNMGLYEKLTRTLEQIPKSAESLASNLGAHNSSIDGPLSPASENSPPASRSNSPAQPTPPTINDQGQFDLKNSGLQQILDSNNKPTNYFTDGEKTYFNGTDGRAYISPNADYRQGFENGTAGTAAHMSGLQQYDPATGQFATWNQGGSLGNSAGSQHLFVDNTGKGVSVWSSGGGTPASASYNPSVHSNFSNLGQGFSQGSFSTADGFQSATSGKPVSANSGAKWTDPNTGSAYMKVDDQLGSPLYAPDGSVVFPDLSFTPSRGVAKQPAGQIAIIPKTIPKNKTK